MKIVGHDDIDVSFFTKLGPFLRSLPTPYEASPIYHRAWKALQNKNTIQKPWAGFLYTAPGQSTPQKMDGITGVNTKLFHPLHLDVSTGGAKTGGSSRGRQVDRELADMINQGKFPQTGKINPATVATMRVLQREKLQPFCAQYAASLPSHGIATTADILCINRAGEVCNVQLKTGFDKNYDEPSPSGVKMMSPHVECPELTQMDDTHRNRHRLQLIVEHAILHDVVQRSYVLVVSSIHTELYPVDTDLGLITGVLHNIKHRDEESVLQNQINALRKQEAVRRIMRESRYNRYGRKPYLINKVNVSGKK